MRKVKDADLNQLTINNEEDLAKLEAPYQRYQHSQQGRNGGGDRREVGPVQMRSSVRGLASLRINMGGREVNEIVVQGADEMADMGAVMVSVGEDLAEENLLTENDTEVYFDEDESDTDRIVRFSVQNDQSSPYSDPKQNVNYQESISGSSDDEESSDDAR